MSGKTISGGEHYEEKIMNYISLCDVFILIVTNSVVYTPHWIKREDQIEKELLHAERSRKRIIPCVHDDIKNRRFEAMEIMGKDRTNITR